MESSRRSSFPLCSRRPWSHNPRSDRINASTSQPIRIHHFVTFHIDLHWHRSSCCCSRSCRNPTLITLLSSSNRHSPSKLALRISIIEHRLEMWSMYILDRLTSRLPRYLNESKLACWWILSRVYLWLVQTYIWVSAICWCVYTLWSIVVSKLKRCKRLALVADRK